MNEESKIFNLPVICQNYPEAPQKEIARDYLLDTIDQMFKNTSIILLEGEEGSGKTTLLGQYGRRHPNTTISCFINTFSKFGYNPENVRLILAEQMYWIINKTTYESDSIDPYMYNQLIFRIQRMAKNKQAAYVFMIDGIDDIPEEDVESRSIILREILPVGEPWLKCLFTGKEVSGHPYVKGLYKPWRIPFFGPNEVWDYFSDFNLGPENLNEIKRMCRGLPGHLASVRRLLLIGKTIEEIIEEDPKDTLDFIHIEFNSSGELSDLLGNALSILAFCFSRFSITDLAKIVKADSQELEIELKKCKFVEIEPSNRTVSFIVGASALWPHPVRLHRPLVA